MEAAAAFFFDAEEPSLGPYYGWPIKRAFFAALLETGESMRSSFHLYWGDLLLHAVTRRISEVQFGAPPKVLPSGSKVWVSRSVWTDDWVARAALGADLNDTLSEGWHRWMGNRSCIDLPASRTFVMYVEPISYRALDALTGQLSEHNWFLGAAEIDRANPLQSRLTTGSLAYRGHFSEGCLYFVQDPWDDPAERWDVSDEVGLDGIRCLWHDSSLHEPPPSRLPRTAVQSDSALRTSELIRSMLEPTHHERLLRALSSRGFRDHERFVAVGVAKLESADRPIVPKEKLVNYALSDVHPTGRHKAYLFRRLLGIGSADWAFLAHQLSAGLRKAEVAEVRDRSAFGTEHHIQYRADIPVVGRNGAVEVVRTAWKIVDGAAPVLITVFLRGETEA